MDESAQSEERVSATIAEPASEDTAEEAVRQSPSEQSDRELSNELREGPAEDANSLSGLSELAGTDSDPELVLGLVGAMGTDLKAISEVLATSLQRFSYKSILIKLSQELCDVKSFGPYPKDVPADERYLKLMKKGTEFRQALGADALARLAIMAIRRERAKVTDWVMKPGGRCAYVLHSLKHPAEVEALRRTYGRRFILLAAYAPRDQRVSDLAAIIAESRNTAQVNDQRTRAERLILRDELERDEEQHAPVPLGQKVGDVFPMADA